MTVQLVVATIVVLAVLAAVAGLAAGAGDVLAPAWRDAAPLPLPQGRHLSADDLGAVRFGVALRGYRMGEVDLVLGRLCAELAERDAELARLRDAQPPPAGAQPVAHDQAGEPVPEPVPHDAAGETRGG
ncbi:MAG: DivIVA domain-containing protein [Frankiaceae bacterium]